MPHTVPLSPIEHEVLGLVARALACTWDTLAGRFEGRLDAAALERIVTMLQKHGLVDITQTPRAYIISITRSGERIAQEDARAPR